MESQVSGALRALADALRVVPDGTVVASDEELVEELLAVEALGRLIDARRVRGAAEVADRSRKELGQDGLAARLEYGRATGMLESLLRVRKGEAKRRIRIGVALACRRTLDGRPLPNRYPTLAAAVADGTVGLDSAELLITAFESVADRADPELLIAAEENLTLEAKHLSPELLQVQLAPWRESMDPDGTEPREAAQRCRRSFRLGRERPDGMTPGSFLAPPEEAAMLRSALDAHRPRDPFDCAGDSAAVGDNRQHPVLQSPEAERSRTQHDFDVLFGMLAAGVEAEHAGWASTGRVSHETVVHVAVSDLDAGKGAGWLAASLHAVSLPTVERTMCDGEVRFIVTGERGEPLFLSRSKRLFTKQQKKAIAARDGGCVWPGCTAPAAWTQTHHVEEWGAEHGLTDVDKGVLLCPFHHHYLHASRTWVIEMHDHVPYLRREAGTASPRLGSACGTTRSTPSGRLARQPRSANEAATTTRAETDRPWVPMGGPWLSKTLEA